MFENSCKFDVGKNSKYVKPFLLCKPFLLTGETTQGMT